MRLSKHIMWLEECMTRVCNSSCLNPLCLVILFAQKSLGSIPLHARRESGDSICSEIRLGDFSWMSGKVGEMTRALQSAT